MAGKPKQQEGGGTPPVKKPKQTKDLKEGIENKQGAVEKMQAAAAVDAESSQSAADVTAELNVAIARRDPVTIKKLDGATPAYNDVLAQCVSLELEALFNSVKITWKIGSIIDPWIARQVAAKKGTRKELMEQVVADLQSVSSVQLSVNPEKIRTACRLAQLAEDIVDRALNQGFNQKDLLSMTSKNVTDEMRTELIEQVASGEIVKKDVPQQVKDRVDAIPPEDREEKRGGDRKSPERKDQPEKDPIAMMKRCNKQLRQTVDDLDGPGGQHDSFIAVAKYTEVNPDLAADFERELKVMSKLCQNLGRLFQDMRSAAKEQFELEL